MDKLPDRFYTLITGASLGLGRELAIECARRKKHLILVALPDEGLVALASELQLQYQVDVIAIEKDLTDSTNCRQLFEEVNRLQIKVNMLINNAGVGSTEFFYDGCLSRYEKQIQLNVLATTITTHLFIGMLKEAGPAYILNVGSLASFFSLQKKQVYGATKSFVFYFSKSLRRELKKDNVFVSVICPGGMFTNTTSRQTIATGNYLSRLSSMYPDKVAPIALDGLLQKKEIIVPGRINKALVFLDRFVPRFVVRFFEERTMQRLYTPAPSTEQAKPYTTNNYAFPARQADAILSSE